jgi:hypothetical protein
MFALFVLPFTAVSNAQLVDVLRVTVSPAKMPANGAGSPALHWRLVSIPSSSDILLTDTDQRNLVSQAIDSMSQTRKNCDGVFFTDHSGAQNNCSLTGAVSGLVLFGAPGTYLNPPTAKASAAPVTVVLRGVWVAKQPPVMDSLCIVAATGSYNPDNCTDPDPSAVTVTLGSLARDYKQGTLPPPFAAILVRVRAEDGSSAAVSQLQQVAVNAFGIAQKMNILPGQVLTQQAALNIRQAISSTYTIDGSRWPAPGIDDVDIGTAKRGPGYLLRIQDLRMVNSASIVLTRGAEVGPQTPAIEKALARRRYEVACMLEKQYRRELSSIVGTIPTSGSAWQIAKVIAKSDQVAGPAIPQSASSDYKACPGEPAPSAESSVNRMEFTATRRAVVAELNGTVNAGVQASPHELLTGTGQLSENHMLLQNSETWADTGSLSLNGGPEIQTANASLGIGRSIGARQTLDFGIDTDLLFLRDQNQRYGYLAGPKFVDEEFGANPNVYLTWTRPASLYALNAVVKASVGEQFRQVALEPPAAYPPFLNHALLNHGWVNGFAPTFSAVVGYDFTHSHPAATGGGLGQIFVSVTGNFLAARNAAGGDFSFNRYSLKSEAEVFFGITGTSDFLLRYGRGVSAISAGAPLFELPQAGGSDNIRGIEQGEYVGRGLGFDQSELAVNAVSAWKWIRHKPTAIPARPASNTSLSSLGITGIFVGGIYDRARIGAGSAPSSLLDLSHGFHGSGVEAEVRGLRAASRLVNIGFVYSLSPNSVLHRKGVFITSVSLDF